MGGHGRFCGGRGVNVGLKGFKARAVERGKKGEGHLGQQISHPWEKKQEVCSVSEERAGGRQLEWTRLESLS